MSNIVVTAQTLLIGGVIYGKDAQVNTDALGVQPTEAQIRGWQQEGKLSLVWPEARGIYVASRAATTAQIAWTVDQLSGIMSVDYGPTTAMASNQAATPVLGVGAIVANLTGLTTATLYYYRVKVYKPDGTFGSYSPIYSFTTL